MDVTYLEFHVEEQSMEAALPTCELALARGSTR